MLMYFLYVFFFFKQKTAYEMRISDWSSDVCSSDLKRVRLSCAPDAETPDLIGAFTLLGFEAHPIGDGPAQVDRGASDSRALLRAVGVSGFAMMNIMQIGRASCRERVCQYV